MLLESPVEALFARVCRQQRKAGEELDEACVEAGGIELSPTNTSVGVVFAKPPMLSNPIYAPTGLPTHKAHPSE